MKSSISRTLRMPALASAIPVLALMVGSNGGHFRPSPELTEIPGRLTYQGKPVPRSCVVFVSAERPDWGFAAVGTVLPDGSFTLRALPFGVALEPGRYDIFISLLEYGPVRNRQGCSETKDAEPGGQAPGGISASPQQPRIPTRFMASDTSGLWVTIRHEPTRIECIDVALRD
jgi:hypothetical protein